MSGSNDAGGLVVRIEGNTTGLSAAMQRGQQITAGASDQIARSIRKVDAEFDKLEASLNPALKAFQDYGNIQQQVAAAVDRGRISQATANRMLAEARERMDQASGAARERARAEAAAADAARQAERATAAAAAQAAAVAREAAAAAAAVQREVAAFDALRLSLDPAARAQRQFADGRAQIDAALKRGHINMGEAIRLNALLAQTHSAVAGATTQAASATARLGGNAQAAGRSMGALGAAGDAVAGSLAGVGSSMGSVGVALAGLGPWGVAAAAALALAGGGMLAIAKAGDTATATMARLASASGSVTQANKAYESLFRLSQQTGVAVEESAGSFVRFAVAAKEIGATNDQVLRLVAGIQKAGIVAGASTQETQAASMQLAQALASGVLQGDELRSLLENMPTLAQALAKELGVGVGQLRQMGAEGKLTASVVMPALLKAAEGIGSEFDKLPPTMSRAAGVLWEATKDFGARLDRIANLSATFAKYMMQGAAALRNMSGAIDDAPMAVEQRNLSQLQARAEDLRLRQSRVQDDRGLGRVGTVAGAMLRRVDGPAEELQAIEQQIAASQLRIAGLKDAARDEEQRKATEAANIALAAQNRANAAAVSAFMEANDQKTKIESDFQKKMREIDRLSGRTAVTEGMVGSGGFIPPAGAGMTDEQRNQAIAAATKERDDALKALNKTEDAHSEKVRGVIDALDAELAAAQRSTAATLGGAAAQHELAIATKVEQELKTAGIPLADKRTAQQKAEADVIERKVRAIDAERESLKARQALDDQDRELELLQAQIGLLGTAQAEREKEIALIKAKQALEKSGLVLTDDQRKKYFENVATISDATQQLQQQQRSLEAVGQAVSTAFDQVGQSIADAFLNGKKHAIDFGSIVRSVLGSLATQAVKLGLINPLVNAIGLQSSPLPTLAAAFGGAGGGGGAASGGVGSILSGIPGIGSLFGGGSFLSTPLWGADIAGPVTAGGIAASGAPTLGSLFGGVGAGLSVGMLLSSLVGRNQTNGMIGSGVGSAAGALIGSLIPGVGTLLGGLLGGAAGGGIGGLFGPGPAHHGWNIDVGLGANGLLDIVKTGADKIDISDKIQAVQQDLAAVNQLLSQYGLTPGIADGSNRILIGGNNAVPQAGSLSAAFSGLKFSAANDDRLNAALQGRTFGNPDELAKFAAFFHDTLPALLDPLGEKAGSEFKQKIDAINKSYDDAIAKMREYGEAEGELTDARTTAINKIWSDVAKVQQDQVTALNVRSLQAGGRSGEAQLVTFDSNTQSQLDALIAQFKAWYGDAFDQNASYQATLALLTRTIADERAAIVAQQTEALRQTGSNLDLRLLQAQTGGGQAYELAAQAEAARRETDALVASLKAMNASASDSAITLVKLEETQAAERAAIIEKYGAQATTALEQAQAQMRQVGGSIRAWLASLAGSTAGGGSPESRLLAAQSAFGADLALARGGNQDALGRISGTADALLSAGREMYASGAQYQALVQMVTSSLGQLPATQSYDEMILQALHDLGGAVDVQVGLDVIRVVSETLNALPEADRNRLQQAGTVLRTVTETLGRLLSVGEVNLLVQAEIVRRSVEEELARTLTPAEQDALVSGGAVVRRIEQLLGRDLTPAEADALIKAEDVTRTINQRLGEDLSASARESLVAAADVLRTVNQQFGRDLTDAERAALVGDATILRTIQQALGRDLTEDERASLVAGGVVPRTISQALGRDLTAAERESLVADATVLRTVEQALGRDLTDAERAGLVQAATVSRDVWQTMQANLSDAERASLLASADVLRGVWQTMQADLSATDRAGLLASADVLRSIEQSIGRQLTLEERDSLVAGGAVTRTVTQALGRDLSADERAGLVVAGQVVRSVEQTLGRLLTPEEQASIVAAGQVLRSVNQVVGEPSGSAVVQGGSVTRDVTQTVTTTETVDISRSVDDKIAVALAGQAATLDRQLQELRTQNTYLGAQMALAFKASSDTEAQLSTLREQLAAALAIKQDTGVAAAWFTSQGGGAEGTGDTADSGAGPSGMGVDIGAGIGGINALGNAFLGGRVVPFARGGLPELVNRPTYAPMALFGEAGPEAIMPLRRGAGGRLGVDASGAGVGGAAVVAAVDRNTQVGAAGDVALRDEMRALRGEMEALAATLRRVVAA